MEIIDLTPHDINVVAEVLRSLRKYGHPMAAYATKIIAF